MLRCVSETTGAAQSLNDAESQMSVDVITEIVIARRLEDVAAYAVNPENVAAWHVNITSVEWKTPPPATVGSRIAFVA